MGLRTGTAYLEGLKDGREVWIEGRRVTVQGQVGHYAKATGLFIEVRSEMIEAWDPSIG